MTHVTLSHHGKVPFLEGQSIGVMESSEAGPAALRLHRIASSRVGDDQRSKTLSLCVNCDSNGPGLSSLCTLKLGDKINITGPVGTAMLLPAELDVILVLVAVDEGIAPFRGYLRWLFHDRPVGSPAFGGLVWLFFGYKAPLYEEEFRLLEAKFPEFRYVAIRQSEDPTPSLQQRMRQDAEEVLGLLRRPNSHLYISGPKALEGTISDVFQGATGNWMELLQTLRQQGRYHCEGG